jgi:hypothetical protein
VENKNNIAESQPLLSWEQLDDIFGNNNVNMFNNFHNTYLRCFTLVSQIKDIKYNIINNK